MPTIQTKDLTGRALDFAVYQCMELAWNEYDNALEKDLDLPRRPVFEDSRDYQFGPDYSPSKNWSQGGPIAEREKINLETRDDPAGAYWVALVPNHRGDGPTALVAAMRCLVAFKLGPTVDIPAELLTNQGAS